MRRLLPVALLFAAIALPSAPAQDKEKPVKGQSFQSEYLPLKVGNRWIYRSGKDQVVVEVERQETIKRKVKQQNDEYRTEPIEAFRLKITSADKILHEHMLIAEDGIYRFSAAGKEIQPPLKIMKLPPMPDDGWNVDSVSENVTLKGRFATQGAKVMVPAYPTGVEAVRTYAEDFQIGPNRMSCNYYFVPKVGIVKQDMKVGNLDMSMELERFEPAK